MRKFKKKETDWIQQLELMRQLYDTKPSTNNLPIETESVVDEKINVSEDMVLNTVLNRLP